MSHKTLTVLRAGSTQYLNRRGGQRLVMPFTRVSAERGRLQQDAINTVKDGGQFVRDQIDTQFSAAQDIIAQNTKPTIDAAKQTQQDVALFTDLMDQQLGDAEQIIDEIQSFVNQYNDGKFSGDALKEGIDTAINDSEKLVSNLLKGEVTDIANTMIAGVNGLISEVMAPFNQIIGSGKAILKDLQSTAAIAAKVKDKLKVLLKAKIKAGIMKQVSKRRNPSINAQAAALPVTQPADFRNETYNAISDNSGFLFNSTIMGREAFLKIFFAKGDKIGFTFFPRDIEAFTYREAQDDLFYSGYIVFTDSNGIITQQVNITGQEGLVIEFGFGAEGSNHKLVQAIINNIEQVEKKGSFNRYKISFVHPAAYISSRAKGAAYQGKISTIVRRIMQDIGVKTEKNNFEPTKNSGLYVNPNLKIYEFLKYLRDISLSKTERAAYVLFTTSDATWFVSREAFNRLPVAPDRVYTDAISTEDSQSVKKMLRGFNFSPVNTYLEYIGVDKIQGFGNDYWRGAMEYTYDVEQELDKKTYVGHYIPMRKDRSEFPADTLYTGFRDYYDMKGYTLNRVEKIAEQLSLATIEIDGDHSLAPGQAVMLELHRQTDQPNEIWETYFSGKWIIRSVEHACSTMGGYKCQLDLYRNALPDVAGSDLLIQAKVVKKD